MNNNEEAGAEDTSRRTFLQRLTGGVLGLGAVVGSWPMFRALVPNILYEPPKRIRLGRPDAFQMGMTYLDEHRVFLLREGNSYSAVSGVCSHLGCTVAATSDGRTLDCPCHGSRYALDGAVLHGPADEPLTSLELEPTEDGGFLVRPG